MKPREVSAVVVQPEVPEEAEMEVVLGESDGAPLGLEGVQILDSEYAEVGEEVEKEPTVAEMPVFEPMPAVPQEAFDTLAALMKESEEITGVEIAQPFSGEGEGMPILVTRKDGLVVGFQPIPEDGKAPNPVTIAYIEKAMDEGAKVEIDPNGDVRIMPAVHFGELPNGEYRATIRLPEGYVEGIKAQAEADNQSLEDWLSFQLQERLELWFFAVGAK
jgi:hypothetical protein